MDMRLKTNKGSIARDRRFNVGKRMGNTLYVHKNYMTDVVQKQILDKALSHIPDDFSFDVVKYDLNSQTLSFISSPDFDDVNEPIVGEGYRVSRDGHIKHISSSGKIYHHKWLFVKDDYDGFDVEESFERSRRWLTLPDVDMSRIGSANFWNTNVIPRLCKKDD